MVAGQGPSRDEDKTRRAQDARGTNLFARASSHTGVHRPAPAIPGTPFLTKSFGVPTAPKSGTDST